MSISNLPISIRQQYAAFYQPSGGYRKMLLKKEALNSANAFDLFSRLAVRVGIVARLKELNESTKQQSFVIQAMELRQQINEIANSAFTCKDLSEMSAVYDTVASVVEGMEECAAVYITTLGDKVLSEDAQNIKRQSYVDKSDIGKNLRRSQAAKNSWKQHRREHETGIKKFHKSTAGKLMHRNLARYQQTRAEGVLKEDDVLVLAKGLSSLCTHLIIEVENRINEDVAKKERDGIKSYQEMYRIFNECAQCLVDSYFDKDQEVRANVLEVVQDYYSLVEEKC
jgi:hypothetical protein